MTDQKTQNHAFARSRSNAGLWTDLVEIRPLGEFRMWTPSKEFVPEKLQQRYWGKTRDGLTGRFWITVIMSDSGISIPNV